MSKATRSTPSRLLTMLALVGAGAAVVAQQPPSVSPPELLLKDYRPQSIYKIPQTEVPRAKFPVIDMHSHVYVKDAAGVAQWIETLDAVGLQKVIVMASGAGTRFDQAMTLFGEHPDRFEVWTGLDLNGAGSAGWTERSIAELERTVAAGARGVGELSDKGGGFRGSAGMHIDDPRMDPILEKIADLGLPVNIHVAEDQWMYEPMDETNDGLMNAHKWRVTPGPTVIGHDEVIDTLDRAVKKHPRVTFIACHFANTTSDLSRLARMLDTSPNLYADIAARFGETSPIPRTMARFYEKYQDRLLYGTDMGTDAEMYRATFRILESTDEHFYLDLLRHHHWAMHGFGLPDEILRKLYRDNALAIMNRAKP